MYVKNGQLDLYFLMIAFVPSEYFYCVSCAHAYAVNLLPVKSPATCNYTIANHDAALTYQSDHGHAEIKLAAATSLSLL